MATTLPIDLAQIRRGCAHCSLRQLCLPAGISPQELQQLDDIVRRRRPLAPGERLFRPGDPLSAVYVARDGAFKTVALSEEGEEQVLGFHLPGELIGLDALGAGAHRCEAVALTTANVCEVPFEQLAGVAAQLPSLQQQLLRVIGQSMPSVSRVSSRPPAMSRACSASRSSRSHSARSATSTPTRIAGSLRRR